MSADQKNRLKVWQGLILVIVAIMALPAITLWLLGLVIFKLLVLLAVWILWLPRGKDILIVYSRSPHWMEYFEAGLIPRLEYRAMTLNWSDRAKWTRFALSTLVFRAFRGETSFNPMVILFRPLRWPAQFRFYESFKQRKHGKHESLAELEAKLEKQLGIAMAPPSAIRSA
jgi:hypothetical protein